MSSGVAGRLMPAKDTVMDIALSEEQKALFEVMEQTRQHLFITGRAGAGKSVLLRHFRENTKKRVVVAAPTGIAALNVRGQTLHSLFKLAPQLHRHGNLSPNNRVGTLLKRIDTLVIDEISMVRADLLDAVDERLREATKKDMPFGGVQVIMFGDVYQLPPVVEEGLMPYFEAVHGGYFFFNALVWRQAEFKIYELTQVFRQKDPIFKDILNAVRDGSVIDSQVKQLNARHGIPVPAEGTVTLAPTNSLVTEINQRRLDQLEGKAYEYKAIITGEMKRSTFPTEEVIQLKVGAQVVLLQNDKDRRWVNGTVATISALKSRKDDKEEGITVHVDGIDYELERATWEEIRYEYDPAEGKVKEEVVSSFTQYPIRLAWAMTIHKSQGQTYESVALDLTTATFAPGQLYVALSRCTSLEGLYLKMPVKRQHIIVEPKVTAFMLRRETITVEVVIEATNLTEMEAVPELIDVDAMFSEEPDLNVTTVNCKGDIKKGDRVVVSRKSGIIERGEVLRIDRKGVASGDDCYFVHLDGGFEYTYACGNEVELEREKYKHALEQPYMQQAESIKVGDRVVITHDSHPETEHHGVVERVDGENRYLVQFDDNPAQYYYREGFNGYHVRPEEALVNPQAEYTSVGSAAQLAPVLEAQQPPANEGKVIWSRDVPPVMTEQEAPRKHGPKSGEPTKKKDFRFPVRLLEALKSVADEDGITDTQLVMALIKSDPRVQRKLFEDAHEQADFYVEEVQS